MHTEFMLIDLSSCSEILLGARTIGSPHTHPTSMWVLELELWSSDLCRNTLLMELSPRLRLAFEYKHKLFHFKSHLMTTKFSVVPAVGLRQML